MESHLRKRQKPSHLAKPPGTPTVKSSSSVNKRTCCRAQFCTHFLFTTLALIVFAIVTISLLPNALKDPQSLVLPARPAMVGVLTPNNRLAKAKKLFEKQIFGPESIIHYNGSLYTSLHNGVIVRIDNDKDIFEIARFGPKDCKTVPECGRPLGMRLSTLEEAIYVADAYLGVFRVSLSTGNVQKVFPFAGSDLKVQFFDDLVFVNEHTFLLTDMSSDRAYHEVTQLLFEANPTGRIFLVDLKQQTYEVLASHIHSPNGIELSSGEPDSVIYAESIFCRLRRLYWTGPKKGQIVPLSVEQSDPMHSPLPGYPDNIRKSVKYPQHYWVALVVSRHADEPSLIDHINASPVIKQILTKMLPTVILDFFTAPNYGNIVRIDDTGKIIESLQDPTGVVVGITQVTEMNDNLYLGNFNLPYLAKLKYE